MNVWRRDLSRSVGDYIDITDQLAAGELSGYRVVQLKSGVYITLDRDAGVGAYVKGGKLLKWWHGYLLTQGIDHFTGLSLQGHGFAADQAEHQNYDVIVGKAADTLGRWR